MDEKKNQSKQLINKTKGNKMKETYKKAFNKYSEQFAKEFAICGHAEEVDAVCHEASIKFDEWVEEKTMYDLLATLAVVFRRAVRCKAKLDDQEKDDQIERHLTNCVEKKLLYKFLTSL